MFDFKIIDIEKKADLPLMRPSFVATLIAIPLIGIFFLHMISFELTLTALTVLFFALLIGLVYTILLYSIRKRRRIIFYRCYDRSVSNQWDAIMNFYVTGYMKKGQHLFATSETTWLDKSRMGPKATKISYKYSANRMLDDCEKLGIKIKKLYVYNNSTIIVLDNEDANLMKLSLPHFQPNVFITTYNLSYFNADTLLEKMQQGIRINNGF